MNSGPLITRTRLVGAALLFVAALAGCKNASDGGVSAAARTGGSDSPAVPGSGGVTVMDGGDDTPAVPAPDAEDGGPGEGPGCVSLTGAKRALCDTLLACVRRTGCAAVLSATCFCGTATPNLCATQAGVADGPCVAEEMAAAESMEPVVISARFLDPAFASGAVHNRLNCERELCLKACAHAP